MKGNKIIAVLAAAALWLPAGAQEAADSVEFNPHWFVGAHAGAQYTLGEAKFGDLLSPTVQLSAGYRFTPWLSVRLSVGAWQSKGGFSGYETGGRFATTTYKYNYVAPAVDVMFNLCNDEANRLAAQGYSLRYNWTGTKVRAVGRGGLSLDFRLSDRVSLGLEGAANVLTDRYNSKRAGNADWYFNVMAGVTINLGRTKNVRRTAPAPVAPAPAPQPVKVEEKPAPAPQPKAEVKTVRRDVFFKINSSVISAAEKAKVEELARYLDNHKTVIVEVTGYADAGTGTHAINERLSAERAAAVMKMLTGEYGVEAGRVRVSHKGDTVQPFAENDMNRVTICIISN